LLRLAVPQRDLGHQGHPLRPGVPLLGAAPAEGPVRGGCPQALLRARRPMTGPAGRSHAPPIPCPFREDPRAGPDGEAAVCSLLREVTGLRDPEACRVRREACEACWRAPLPSRTDLNPVAAALLYALADEVGQRGGAVGCDSARAHELRRWAEAG